MSPGKASHYEEDIQKVKGISLGPGGVTQFGRALS